MTRYCGSCGTEVDDSAVFCPTCGQPIDDGDAAELPPAPAWPDASADDERAPESPEEPTPRDPQRDVRPEPADAPTRIEQRPPPVPERRDEREPEPVAAPRDASPPPPADERGAGRADPGSPSVDLPLTMPVTLSGWLIGVGSVLAVLGLIVILVATVLNVIDLLLLLALAAVAASVFLSARLPAVPHLRLATLVVALIAFGVALDRVGLRGGGVGELLLFLGAAAAAIGAIILELGQDQPLGGPQR